MNRRHYYCYELGDGVFGAGVAIMILFVIFLCTLINCIGIFIGFNLWKNDIGTFLAVGLIIVFDILLYYTLFSKEKWRKYEVEFKTYSRKKNRIINRIILFFIILLFVLLILSFVIWKQFRDAGLIM